MIRGSLPALGRAVVVCALVSGFAGAAGAQDGPAPTTLFQNARVFDGTATALSAPVNVLMRGFTSVRDLGGPTFGLGRAIDEGVLPGPRIWPSGATISQTSGHGDFRTVLDHTLPR